MINYIKGLGLKVSFTSKDEGIAASWSLDNTEIRICKNYNTTKIETILSLIHELGHAKHNLWEKNREVDARFEKALDHVDEAEEQETDTQKKQRKIILDNEIAGTRYWHDVYRETNMKFPIWKLEAAIEFDTWQYRVFYETGHDPKRKDKKKKLKEIKNKHRNRNG